MIYDSARSLESRYSDCHGIESMHKSIESIIEEAAATGRRLPDVILAREVEETGAAGAQVRDRIRRTLGVMRSAIDEGLKGESRSPSGLTGGRAASLWNNGPRI